MFYVVIPRINGRQDMLNIATTLDERGYEGRVEYNEGGWMDRELETVLPHLRFNDEQDAIAYVLTYGGMVSKTLPYRDFDNVDSKIG
jgi:hypothetical protein